MFRISYVSLPDVTSCYSGNLMWCNKVVKKHHLVARLRHCDPTHFKASDSLYSQIQIAVWLVDQPVFVLISLPSVWRNGHSVVKSITITISQNRWWAILPRVKQVMAVCPQTLLHSAELEIFSSSHKTECCRKHFWRQGVLAFLLRM